MKICVLICCHNRKEKTIGSLSRLASCTLPGDVQVSVILFDDGSTDGTSDLVQKMFPNVEIHKGDGSFFWNRSMNFIYGLAMSRNYDYYLWLNDDVVLYENAFVVMFNDLFGHDKETIVVGSTRSMRGMVTYGGAVRNNIFNPLSFRRIVPAALPQPCDAINGNIVLIPSGVAAEVGNIDPRFEHAMGDTDYGLRASALGYRPVVATEYLGECESNPPVNHIKGSLVETLRSFSGRKGLPVYSWYMFTRRHGGVLWPLIFALPYVKIVGRWLVHLR